MHRAPTNHSKIIPKKTVWLRGSMDKSKYSAKSLLPISSEIKTLLHRYIYQTLQLTASTINLEQQAFLASNQKLAQNKIRNV